MNGVRFVAVVSVLGLIGAFAPAQPPITSVVEVNSNEARADDFRGLRTPEAAKACLEEADLRLHDGELRPAAALFSECVDYWRDKAAGNPEPLARALIGLAAVQAAGGWHRRALVHYDQAHTILEKSGFGNGSSPTAKPTSLLLRATSYDGIATAYCALGDYGKAISAYDTAIKDWKTACKDLSVQEEAYLGFYRTHLNRVKALMAHDRVTTCLGDGTPEVRVKTYLEVLVGEVEKRYGVGDPCLADFYNTLADLYLRMGGNQLCLAQHYAEQARNICDAHGAFWGGFAARNLLGVIDYQVGGLDSAEQAFKEILADCRKTGNKALEAQTLWRLGNVSSRRGELEGAKRLYQESLEILDQIGVLPVLQFRARFDLATTLVHLGDTTQAVEVLQETVRIIVVAGASTTGGPVQYTRFLAHFARGHDLLVKLLLEQGHLREALYYADEYRKRMLAVQLQLAGVDPLKTLPETIREQLTRELEKLLWERDAQLGASSPPADAPVRLKRLEDRIVTVLNKMYDSNPHFRRLLGKAMGFPGFQLYLESLQPRLRQHRSVLLYYYLGEEECYLLVLADGKLQHHKLEISAKNAADYFEDIGPDRRPVPLNRGLVQCAVREWLVELTRPSGPAVRNERGFADPVNVASITQQRVKIPVGPDELSLRPFDTGQAVAFTDALLPREVRKQMRHYEQAIIVPDGILHRLPFQALPVGTQQADLNSKKRLRYLIDEDLPPISYVPSIKVLELLLDRDVQRTPREKIVLVGGQLDGSKWEVRGVADLFPSEDVIRITPEFCGQRPAERLLRAFAPYARILLISDHAVSDVLRNDGVFGYISMYAGQGKPQDNRLELREVLDLNLLGCELTVLSACETAVGSPRYLEIGNSLARAFLTDGATRVVASLWKVNDRATKELMVAFFEQVARQSNTNSPADYAAALQTAMREVRQRQPAPYYWAPFVLMGPATSQP